jgi:glycosyltransferase involved in cell wall biosynthesis
MLSPMPPAETGIATYSASVLAALEESGFTDRNELDVVWPVGSDADRRLSRSDIALYHVGNNAMFHRAIYRYAIERPGIAVLHDLALDDLTRFLVRAGDPLGPQSVVEARMLKAGARRTLDVSEALAMPWCAHVVRRSRGVIVHSRFARTYLEELGCRTPVYVAPHPVVETEERLSAARARGETMRAALARRRSSPAFDVLIGVLGDLSASKGIEAILDALPRIGADVHLVLVGRTASGWDVTAAVRRGGHEGRVTIAPDVSDRDFLGWLSVCDVVVNLRHPHRGEVSGSLIRSLQMGRPTLVSATGTYLEWPPDSVVRMSPGVPSAEELASVLTLLAVDRGRRTSVGQRGRVYVLEHCSPSATADVYERAIRDTLEILADPARRAVARWAAGLAQMGASAETARRGLGTRFSEELEAVSEARASG